MKILICEISIGAYRFNYVTDLRIKESWDTFTNTATIVLPNKFRDKNKTIVAGLNNVFKRGDRVEIKVGYFPTLQKRFMGFVSKIKPDSPLEIECEDRMWLLKQKNISSKIKF